MSSHLLIGIFASSETVSQALRQYLAVTAGTPHWFSQEADFLTWVDHHRHHIDCLVVQQSSRLIEMLAKLVQQKNLLPLVVLLETEIWRSEERGGRVISALDSALPAIASLGDSYHQAVICVDPTALSQIDLAIVKAINAFLHLSTSEQAATVAVEAQEKTSHALQQHQQRLTDKLKERLGYLGVYYKRHPDNFLRNMNPTDRDEFIQQLRTDYRAILIIYFSDDARLNQKIDDLVNMAFFADVSVAYIVEIHMELMEEFSKQLKLEGRSEEILLDYRLTLIDIIAHLCEMYRRSIPREIKEAGGSP